MMKSVYVKALCVGLLTAQVVHAGMVKDVTRFSMGLGAGLSVGYGLQALENPNLIALGIMDARVIPALALIGAGCGTWFTSYGKIFRAQLKLRNLDQKLIALVAQLTYGKTANEVIDEIQEYYVNTALPLIIAVKNLMQQDDYLAAAVELLEWVVDSLPDDSARRASIVQWLDEISAVRVYVRYALTVIQQDARFAQMLKVKAMQDLAAH